MSLEDWQRALRRQFVADKSFGIVKLDGHPVFSDYRVYNPESANTYKVSIRDKAGERNFCECLDFKTNRLGTCKHIEAVIRSIESKRGMKKLFRDGYTPPYSSVFLAYGATRQVKIRIGIDKADEFAILSAEFFENDILKPGLFGSFEVFLRKAKAIDEGFRCYDDALSFVLETRQRERRLARLASAESSGDPLSSLVRTKLYPYQREGVLFAAKAGRAMIADEMGLGKTVQAICAAMLLKREEAIQKVLVIAPTSLKYQWRSEIERFAGEEATVIEGGPLVREKLYRRDSFFTVMSYHTVGHDLEAIDRMAPDLVILDEAQRIKNWKTKLARNVKKIASPHAFVLTGTPLENNLEELYSIVQFIDPFKLGPYRAFLVAHEQRDAGGKVIGYQRLNEVGATLADIVIRRRKNQVLLQLPERIDERRFVPMTERQREIHEEYANLTARLVFRWRKQGFLNEADRQRLLIYMNCMRMVCDSSYILDQDENNRHDNKIGELLCLLDEALSDGETKAVVFSQWERMTRLVAKELEARDIGHEHLHGGVPSIQRQGLFDRFNKDPACRVFVSTDAGSTGLNLQSASILVNLDLPWNPAVLEQRISRIHRIGQKRSVHIINYISIDTIESRMLTVLGFKADLSRGILDGGEDAIFMDDKKYGHFMETVEQLAVPTAPSAAESAEGANPIEGAVIAAAAGMAPAGEAAVGTAAPRLNTSDLDPGEEQENREFSGESQTAAAAASAVPAPAEKTEEALLADRTFAVLGDLARVMADPEASRRFVSNLVAKDQSTGATYLKIPVQNEDAALAAMTALGKLFAALTQP